MLILSPFPFYSCFTFSKFLITQPILPSPLSFQFASINIFTHQAISSPAPQPLTSFENLAPPNIFPCYPYCPSSLLSGSQSLISPPLPSNSNIKFNSKESCLLTHCLQFLVLLFLTALTLNCVCPPSERPARLHTRTGLHSSKLKSVAWRCVTFRCETSVLDCTLKWRLIIGEYNCLENRPLQYTNENSFHWNAKYKA